MLVIVGMPMFYMELAAGQYFSLGPIGTWGAICPLFKGTSISSNLISASGSLTTHSDNKTIELWHFGLRV